MDNTFERRVRERAYDLWLRDGGVRGQVDHHWFQAVRDILAAPEEVPVGAPVSPQRRVRPASSHPAGDEKHPLARRATIAVGAG